MFKAPTKWLLKGPYLYAIFRFPVIRFDAPTLLSFSGCTHAHAKCPPVVTNSVTKHKTIKSVRNLFVKMLTEVGHKKLQSRCLLVEIRWLPLKWLILRQNNETQRTHFRTLLSFLLLLPESVRTVVWVYADVITKFSGIDEFPFSIPSHDSCGAPLRAARADAPL